MICKIDGCVEEVMGCDAQDGCPADDLCPGHYFGLAYLEGKLSTEGRLAGNLRRQLKVLIERDGIKLENYRARSVYRGGF